MEKKKRLYLTYVFVLVIATLTRAESGDPTLRTDHPQYPGEGAFQTAADCVRFAVGDAKQPQEQALAMYNWMLTHQWHLPSPQEWLVPRVVPDTMAGHEDLMVWDAARARFSYGYGLCGTVHAWNEVYWRQLRMPARRRAFPGHTNSEIFYDGSWHAFDTDMAGLLFRRDGIVAGYDDIRGNQSLIDSVKPPIPHYPFAWPSDNKVMKAGWRQVARGGKWFSLYNGGYEAHPGIVRLRRGETFTRWYNPDHYGGPKKRRFWHHQKNGPYRDWTFVNSIAPLHDGAKHNALGRVAYCNGEFVIEPIYENDQSLHGAAASSGNVEQQDSSPRVYSKDGKPAHIIFDHFSPYVICGDPVDDANPMSKVATDGLVVAGQLKGEVKVEVSADQGQTWRDTPNKLSLDLTEYVKGRYGWQVRFSWKGNAGIDFLRFTTTTQVNPAMYPRLKPGGSKVVFRETCRGVHPVLPNWESWSEAPKHFESVERRGANVEYKGRGLDSRLAYVTTNNKPGQVVFPITAPGPLLETRAAMRYAVRVPPPKNHDFRLEISEDNCQSWRTFAKAEIPLDNEHSSGWLAGAVPMREDNQGKAWVRVTFWQDGYSTGLIDAQFYGIYRCAPAEPVEITHGWLEGNKSRQHTVKVPFASGEFEYQVDCGNEIRDDFVKIAVGHSPVQPPARKGSARSSR